MAWLGYSRLTQFPGYRRFLAKMRRSISVYQRFHFVDFLQYSSCLFIFHRLRFLVSRNERAQCTFYWCSDTHFICLLWLGLFRDLTFVHRPLTWLVGCTLVQILFTAFTPRTITTFQSQCCSMCGHNNFIIIPKYLTMFTINVLVSYGRVWIFLWPLTYQQTLRVQRTKQKYTLQWINAMHVANL